MFFKHEPTLTHLPEEKCTCFPVSVRGNDPSILSLPKHIDENVFLIGTSGFRSIEIACMLSGKSLQLLLIDNSKWVIKFWEEVSSIIKKSENKDDFLKLFLIYHDDNQEFIGDYSQENLKYIERLFSTYGFKKIKTIIDNIILIRQSWEDENTFLEIKKIIGNHHYEKVFVYPSNIVAELDMKYQSETVNKILKNIQFLNPDLAIHTDLILFRKPSTHFKANKVVTIIKDNHFPHDVAEKLGLRWFEEDNTKISTYNNS